MHKQCICVNAKTDKLLLTFEDELSSSEVLAASDTSLSKPVVCLKHNKTRLNVCILKLHIPTNLTAKRLTLLSKSINVLQASS